jgi:hypothetical protein
VKQGRQEIRLSVVRVAMASCSGCLLLGWWYVYWPVLRISLRLKPYAWGSKHEDAMALTAGLALMTSAGMVLMSLALPRRGVVVCLALLTAVPMTAVGVFWHRHTSDSGDVAAAVVTLVSGSLLLALAAWLLLLRRRKWGGPSSAAA